VTVRERSDRDEQVWRNLATLVGPGAEVSLSGASVEPPSNWKVTRMGHAVQMAGERVHPPGPRALAI
jgi:hypothetical protein